MTTETAHPRHDINSPENLARREHGLEVARSVDGEAAQAVIRPGLDPRSRQLVTIGVLTALGG